MNAVMEEIAVLTGNVPNPRESKGWRAAETAIASRRARESALLEQLRGAQAQRRSASEELAALTDDASATIRGALIRALSAAVEAERVAAEALGAYKPSGDEERERGAVEAALGAAAKELAKVNQQAGEKVLLLVQALVAEAATLAAVDVVERGIFEGAHPFGGIVPGMRTYLPDFKTRLYAPLDGTVIGQLESWLRHARGERVQ
jgi:hypothetical protein